MPFLTVGDLLPFAPGLDPVKAQAMIDDASAIAVVEAPGILADGFLYADAVKAVLRGAIIRWLEAGSGARQSVQVGQIGTTFDNSQPRRGMFLPSELAQLRGLAPAAVSGSFTLSLAGPDVAV